MAVGFFCALMELLGVLAKTPSSQSPFIALKRRGCMCFSQRRQARKDD